MSKENVIQVETTYGKALAAISAINPPTNNPHNQGRAKSELARAKGELGVHVYNIKHDIRDAFRGQDDKATQIREDAQPLLKKKEELQGHLVGKDYSEASAIRSEIKELDTQLEELDTELLSVNNQTETVTLRKGKLKLSAIQDLVDSSDLEALEDFIDFSG